MQTLTTGNPGNMRMLSFGGTKDKLEIASHFWISCIQIASCVRLVIWFRSESEKPPPRPTITEFILTQNNMPYFGIIKNIFYVAKRETLIYK